jgi:hypothetical protein
VRLQVEARDSVRRCALCHGDAGRAAATCAGCGTVAHADCRAEARGCPSLGCALAVRPTLQRPPTDRGTRYRGQALGAGLVAGELALAGAFALAWGGLDRNHAVLEAIPLLAILFGLCGAGVGAMARTAEEVARGQAAPLRLLSWPYAVLGLSAAGAAVLGVRFLRAIAASYFDGVVTPF